jgi:hypothetical protein
LTSRVSSAAQRRVIWGSSGSGSINQQPCLIIIHHLPFLSFLPFFPYSPSFFLELFGISFDGKRRGGGWWGEWSINQSISCR